MPRLRLRETFNRLLKNQYTQFLKKGAVALVLAASLATPAAADHDQNNDLDSYRSTTEHSQELRSIQQKFNREAKHRRIILIDRDWLQINEAINDKAGDDKALRNRYIAEYIERYGNLHLPKKFFDKLSDWQLYKSPHSQLFSVSNASGDRFAICLVHGGRGEQDGSSMMKRFIGVSRVTHGDEFADAPVRLKPDAEAVKKFITYHEIGHCMDQWYFQGRATAKTLTDYLDYAHHTESFADVYSLLMMAREEGIRDLSETIANMRLAGAAFSGPYQWMWGDDKNPMSVYGSYIYATHRSVRAAQDYIDRHGVQKLKNMTFQQLAEAARDIVDKNALTKEEGKALVNLFNLQYDLSKWEQAKDSVPEIAKLYPHALKLKAELEKALRDTLDLNHIPPQQSALERITFLGTPLQRQTEARDKYDWAAMRARAQNLAQEMVSDAGGSYATINSLIRVYTDNKDRWRETLSTGTEAQRKNAEKNLEVAGQALWLAAHKVRGTAPTQNQSVAPPVLVMQKAKPPKLPPV